MIELRDDESPAPPRQAAASEKPLESFDIFPWSSDFETGVAFIDTQHQTLVRLLNALARQLILQSGSPTCGEVLRELSDYAIYHFAAEEKFMRQALQGDASELAHLQAHRDFVGEIGRLGEQAATPSEGVEKVVAFLSHWLAHHILDVDRRMAMVVLAVRAGTPLAEAREQADRAMSGAVRELIEAVLGMYDILSSRTLRLMREVIERRRVESVLRDSEGRLREQKEFLAAIFENALDAAVLMDAAGVITGWNGQAEQVFGWPREAAVGRPMHETIIPARYCAAHVQGMRHFLATGEGPLLNRRVETFAVDRAGREFPVELSITPVWTVEGHQFSAFIRDISARRRSEFHNKLRTDILEKLARGIELPALLDALVRGVEAEQPGCVASILLVDDEGRLRRGAAPSLPEAYSAAFDGVPIGDGVGSCGTAAFRGEMVIVEDIRAHPYWRAYRDLAASAGVRACWAQPVFDTHGRVVATFAIYQRTPRAPAEHDMATIVHASNLASIAIGRHHEEKRLKMAMLALESTRESVYWLDVYGRMIYVNPATEEELGYSAAQLRQMTVSDIAPGTRADLFGPSGHLARAGTPGLRKFQSVHRHRDGHEFPVEVDGDGFEFDGQKYYVYICRDISERKENERRLQMAMYSLESTRESACWVDEDGRILYANPAMEQELGYSVAELLTMSIPDIDPNCPADLWGGDGELMLRMKEAGLRKFSTRHRHRDGHLIPVEIDSDAFDFDGRTYFIAFARDISERLAAEEFLRRSEAKFTAMFSMTPEPMALTRLADGMMLEVSRSYGEYFGYRPEELVGRSALPGDLGLWVDAGQRRQWREAIERNGEVIGFEAPLRRKDGSLVDVQISGKRVEIGREPCIIVTVHDVTEQKQHAEHLEQIANHDPLTGLPNRLLLGDRLRQAIANNQRAHTRVAVCYIDLDGFKEVNDSLGHQVGDLVLIEVARRLLACVRGGDTVARLGGDEFVVLLSDLYDDEACHQALERLLQAVSAPYAIGDSRPSGISASIGVTVFPSDRADPDTLMRHADLAMYAAKQAGKNRYQMFNSSMPSASSLAPATAVRTLAADASQAKV